MDVEFELICYGLPLSVLYRVRGGGQCASTFTWTHLEVTPSQFRSDLHMSAVEPRVTKKNVETLGWLITYFDYFEFYVED